MFSYPYDFAKELEKQCLRAWKMVLHAKLAHCFVFKMQIKCLKSEMHVRKEENLTFFCNTN
jgi:hypothetical protein